MGDNLDNLTFYKEEFLRFIYLTTYTYTDISKKRIIPKKILIRFLSLKPRKRQSLRILLVLFSLVFITRECFALPEEEIGQNDWYRIWSSPDTIFENCYDMVLDSENNIYITGTVYSTDLQIFNMILIKYQNTSDSFISRNWHMKNSTYSYAMAIDSLSNIYLAGKAYNGSKKVFVLVKFDNDLNYVWNRTWGHYEDNHCNCIAIDSQDNIYLGGRIKQENDNYDICLIKYNKSGDLQWHQIWSHYGDLTCNAIAIDLSDHLYLTGCRKDPAISSEDDICLLKYNSSGYLEWSTIHDTPTFELGLGIALDSKEDIYIVGQTDSDLSPNFIETFLIKYTKEGVYEWNKIYSGEVGMWCYSTDIAIDSNDNIYLGGSTKLIESNGPSASVIKYDNNGTLQWHVEWGEPHIEECRAIALDSMNNVLIAGDISAYEYQIDGIFIVRNPKTRVSSIDINNFSIILIIFCGLIGIFLTLYKLSKKNLFIK